MFKGILDKLFLSKEKEPVVQSISHEEVEALVDARLKEHTAAIEKSIADQKITNDQEDCSLSPKQITYALSLIEKARDFELATDSTNLKVSDLNKLISYNRYKNRGILVNLVKKGILRYKQKA